MEQETELTAALKKRKWLLIVLGVLLVFTVTNPSMKQFGDYLGNPKSYSIQRYRDGEYRFEVRLPRKLNYFVCSVYSTTQSVAKIGKGGGICPPVCPPDKNKTPSFIGERRGLYVVWEGIEPPTQGFSVLCSTN